MKKKMDKERIEFIVVGMNFDAKLLSRQFFEILMDDDACDVWCLLRLVMGVSIGGILVCILLVAARALLKFSSTPARGTLSISLPSDFPLSISLPSRWTQNLRMTDRRNKLPINLL